MGFNFPNTPTVGQSFTPPGGPTYVWDGNAWANADVVPPILPSSVIISKQTISGSIPSLETVIPAGYDWFKYQVIGLKAAANQNPYVQVSVDGSTYITGSSYAYGTIGNASTDGQVGSIAASTTNWALAPSAVDFLTAGVQFGATLEFDAGVVGQYQAHGHLVSGSYSTSRSRIAANYFLLGVSGRIQKIRLQCASTNLLAGKVILHGQPS